MYVVAIVHSIGLAQFNVSRVVTYAAVGIVENAVPAYSAKIALVATLYTRM